MLDQVVYVAAVSVLGVFEQAYFSLQVIQARRKYSVSPPSTAGPLSLNVSSGRTNCSEYFPIFLTVLWVSGIFFSQAISSLLGLLYLYGRYKYFQGYGKSALGRLAPLYFSAKILWALLAFSTLGVLNTLNQLYFDVDFLQLLNRFFM